MRLKQVLKEQLLHEMPYAPEDENGNTKVLQMDTKDYTHFFSERTLAEEWKLVKQAPNYSVYINNAHNMAVIGEMGTRKADGAKGMYVIITCDFKDTQQLTHEGGPQLKGALQIDLVVANHKKLARGGYGSLMYFALVEAGITIISDNTQYRGGKELWKNIAGQAASKGFVVNVIENGQPVLDDNGQPLVYDGTNIPDDNLWSARPLPRTMPTGLTPAGVEQWHAKQEELKKIPDKTMTLFVLRKQ